MIHTYERFMKRIAWNAIYPCLHVLLLFFWGEAAWGLTAGLRHLRWLKLVTAIGTIASVGLVVWGMVGYSSAKAAASDSYSYYEGKVLEERVAELQRKLDGHEENFKRLVLDSNTQTLLAVRMQGQIEQQQKLLDAGIKVLGAVVVAVAVGLFRDLIHIRLRTERQKLRRKEEESE